MTFLSRRYFHKYFYISASKFLAHEVRRKSKYPEACRDIRMKSSHGCLDIEPGAQQRRLRLNMNCALTSRGRTKFYKNNFKTKNLSGFCNWRARALGRCGFLIRKATISQSVPDDWGDILQEAADSI